MAEVWQSQVNEVLLINYTEIALFNWFSTDDDPPHAGVSDEPIHYAYRTRLGPHFHRRAGERCRVLQDCGRAKRLCGSTRHHARYAGRVLQDCGRAEGLCGSTGTLNNNND
jgi:hypothetical protein